MSIPLPIDVTTDAGTKRMIIGSNGVSIASKTIPVVDVDSYYLKKVIIE
jgi:hypothetical protein